HHKAKAMNDIIEAASKNLSGILTAHAYLHGIEGCFNGGFCPTELWDGGTPEKWAAALKEAEHRLVYHHSDMAIKDFAVVGAALTPGAVMDFDAVITTTRKDRDGDILETEGAVIDPYCPLLWQHTPIQPIGKMVGLSVHTKEMAQGRFAIADTVLGRDAATLVEMGALRISHGFEPLEYKPIEKDGRWHILKFNVLEVSLVSVPSNVDAIITAFSRQKLHSPLIKKWAQSSYENRQVISGVVRKNDECACKHGKKEMEVKEHVAETLPDLEGDTMHKHEQNNNELQGFFVCNCGNVGTPSEFCKANDGRVGCPACGLVGAADDFRPSRPSFEKAAAIIIADAEKNPELLLHISKILKDRAQAEENRRIYEPVLRELCSV
ncbi:MAG: HK97 family phage prohead protease, partial [Bacteroidota bacterium]